MFKKVAKRYPNVELEWPHRPARPVRPALGSTYSGNLYVPSSLHSTHAGTRGQQHGNLTLHPVQGRPFLPRVRRSGTLRQYINLVWYY